MPWAFLSHSSLDKPFVRLLWRDLARSGVHVWTDEGDLEPGDSASERISRALGTVDYVVVLLSPDALASKWVMKELHVGVSRSLSVGDVTVIPVLLPRCDVRDLPPILSDVVFVDVREAAQYDAAIEALVSRMRCSDRGETVLRPLPVDSARRDRLVAVGMRPHTRDWAVDYLLHKLSTPDPTELYWVYVALGQIGGDRAKEAVEEGLSAADELARKGARQAKEFLDRSDCAGSAEPEGGSL